MPYSILIVVGTCTARDLVPASVCRGAATCRGSAPRIAAEPRAALPRVRVSRRSRLAINRSEEIVFDPSSRID